MFLKHSYKSTISSSWFEINSRSSVKAVIKTSDKNSFSIAKTLFASISSKIFFSLDFTYSDSKKSRILTEVTSFLTYLRTLLWCLAKSIVSSWFFSALYTNKLTSYNQRDPSELKPFFFPSIFNFYKANIKENNLYYAISSLIINAGFTNILKHYLMWDVYKQC